MKEQEINPIEKSCRLGINRAIAKPIDGWNPPDTEELRAINNMLNGIGKRIHALRIAFLLNNEKENGRIRRILASRKKALEKAYQKGKCARRKRHHARKIRHERY
jgi:hypothetical protein